MIALDTSAIVAFLGGSRGSDVDMVAAAFEQHQGILPPVVLTELLSDPRLASSVRSAVLGLPLLEITDGFWERSGQLRAAVLASGRKARLGDALIAQCCLDASVPLVTRDRDFRHFAKGSGLVLL